MNDRLIPPLSPENRKEVSRWLKDEAMRAGFDLSGVAAAQPGLGYERLTEWLSAGKHGEMNYMASRAEARRDPNHVLEGVRSLLVVACGYRTREPAPPRDGQGRVARYAWGRDYHDVVFDRLKEVGRRLEQKVEGVRFRPAVDSAPVMERDYARLAGLGWFGKNTLLINPKIGSWFFLGALLTDLDLEPDAPFESDHCGTCVRCLEACPTQAFDGPRQLDPRRCISYLTIEHRGVIDDTLKAKMADWVFGCDVCQEVCPWNHEAKDGWPEFAPRTEEAMIPLETLLDTDESRQREPLRGTPLVRARGGRLRRNALIAAGNQGGGVPLELAKNLSNDTDPAVADAAAWAISRWNSGAMPAPRLIPDLNGSSKNLP